MTTTATAMNGHGAPVDRSWTTGVDRSGPRFFFELMLVILSPTPGVSSIPGWSKNRGASSRVQGEYSRAVCAPRLGALHVAEALRQQLEETSVTWNGQEVSTTASIGLAIGGVGRTPGQER